MKTNRTIIDLAVAGLRHIATDLEEFQLQLALGKAEAADKFEDIKKTLADKLHDAKMKLDHDKTWLKEKMDQLRVQLALGKAETRDAFSAQEKKIRKAIKEIEDDIRKRSGNDEAFPVISTELMKLKIQLDILALHYELGKMEARDILQKRRKDLAKKMVSITDKLESGKETIEQGLSDFAAELDESYKLLKKTFHR